MSETFAELFEQSLNDIDMKPGSIITGTIVDVDSDSFQETSLTLHLGGGDCDCGCCRDDTTDYDENVRFPYLTRFLADPPPSLTNLELVMLTGYFA